MNKNRIVVLSGAGISAESGIDTFRDNGGLWEKHDVREVATPEAWLRDPDLVLNFYNQRRKQLTEVVPNAAHIALSELENHYEVCIVTQNVDDLHERAGSTDVIHLHGQLSQARSSVDPLEIHDIDGWEMKKGQLCSHGRQLRPNIVWFGEPVPLMGVAANLVAQADLLLIVGTSLNVYPASGLVEYAALEIPTYLIDPGTPVVPQGRAIIHIKEKAGTALPRLVKKLVENCQ